ncbi:2-hydroxyacid dehydrogenase [Microvirga sp. W0021]|uniref:2-hydroxyacid dehydrogenase n=2 Tax=Hohaiivirga grylli TaxID=3133970 RepID=A0ABV0BLH6_9HYPH
MPEPDANLEKNFIIHRLDKATDKHALVAEVGPRIQGIVSAVGKNPVTADIMRQCPQLKIVSGFGVGYDNIDTGYAAENGIIVTNTPDVLNEEVADTALALLLATLRLIPQADRFVREGKWLKGGFPLSPTLRDRKAGIVGLGRIGKAIAKRLEAFGVSVAYHGRRKQDDISYPYYGTIKELAAVVDTLIIIIPGGKETYHAVNADVLKALGPDGVLINVARGTVVDEQALITALKNKTILAAGLDVFEKEPQVPQELIDLDNTVLLPHIGSASVHTRNAMGNLVVKNIEAFFSGKAPLTPVPETPWSK